MNFTKPMTIMIGMEFLFLKVVDYQWDLYEKDSIDRVVPKLKIKLN